MICSLTGHNSIAWQPAVQSSLLEHHCWPIPYSFLSDVPCTYSVWRLFCEERRVGNREENNKNNSLHPLRMRQTFTNTVVWAFNIASLGWKYWLQGLFVKFGKLYRKQTNFFFFFPPWELCQCPCLDQQTLFVYLAELLTQPSSHLIEEGKQHVVTTRLTNHEGVSAAVIVSEINNSLVFLVLSRCFLQCYSSTYKNQWRPRQQILTSIPRVWAFLLMDVSFSWPCISV